MLLPSKFTVNFNFVTGKKQQTLMYFYPQINILSELAEVQILLFLTSALDGGEL
jgi:hypothetical protein